MYLIFKRKKKNKEVSDKTFEKYNLDFDKVVEKIKGMKKVYITMKKKEAKNDNND